jgi:hypothetical protein
MASSRDHIASTPSTRASRAVSLRRRATQVAKKALPDGVDYVEVFDLYGRDELEENTFDTQHATGENYLEWNDRVMRAVDCQLGSKCIADNKCDGPAPAPRPAPRPSPDEDEDGDDEPAPPIDECQALGQTCKEEGDCCEAPPRSCFLKKGKRKGKCLEAYAGGRRCSAWRTRRSSAGRRTSRLSATYHTRGRGPRVATARPLSASLRRTTSWTRGAFA